MRIAVFDRRVTANNPAGSCTLRLVAGLCHRHDFTIFAAEFENPCPDRIEWVRIPVFRRPMVVQNVMFMLFSNLAYHIRRLYHRNKFDIVQAVDNSIWFGDVVHQHFGYRHYLATHWPHNRPTGLRRLFTRLSLAFNVALEPWIYQRAGWIVTPSEGLRRELMAYYGDREDKTLCIYNPIDVERFRAPSGFDLQSFRKTFLLQPSDTVLVFVALGHFERKGLALVLSAMQQVDHEDLKLLVVGALPDAIEPYRRRVVVSGLKERVRFVGMQYDVRPFLWSADALVFPSAYEAFPLVALEAAAAGLPLIVTPVNGVEEFVRDSENGLLITRSVEGLVDGLNRFLALSPEQRQAMVENARRDISGYDETAFLQSWEKLYSQIEKRFTE